ncbi:MAG: hypothetical protein H6722_06985 [Sandaracinus sp.]|nr:hypothetical protein [Sandaracinus sp.]MCB9612182.1 hypothetical protein [Sandaracinus sp.]MCB9618394.1 hypothetical protein [Sandaracinus sp.]MCB9623081.1 hypothetical protein [Sandaracinus sp.]
MDEQSKQRERLVAEVARLRKLRKDLDREWRGLRWSAIPTLLAIPAFFLWGVIGSSLVILGVGSIVVTAAYLILVRRKEYEGDIRIVQREIAILDHAAASRS